MELTHEFANRISAIGWTDFSPLVVSNAKIAILDTFGVTLAGSREDCANLLLRVPGMQDPGPSLVFGHGIRTSALKAKFESCAARALDDGRTSRLYAALDDLENVASVRDLLREMNGGK